MLLYMIVMLKPLLPIVTDWYEHEFNPIQHEVQVHMVYGSQHLGKDLAKSNSEDKHNQTTTKDSDPIAVHIPAQGVSVAAQLPSKKPPFATTICDVSTVYFDTHSPPPKCCSL